MTSRATSLRAVPSIPSIGALRVRLPLGVFIGLAAVLLPWLTWIPTRAVPGDSAPDVIQAPARLLALLPLLLVAAWLWGRDRWLSAFVLYVVAWQWAQPGRFWNALEASFIAFGAVGLVLVRELKPDWRVALAQALAWSGAAEAVYVTLTAVGLNPFGVHQGNTAGGTLGHSTYAGAFLALTAPLAPAILLPIFALGLIASHSALAVIAAVFGLAIGHGIKKPSLLPLLGVPAIALAFYQRGASLDSLHNRLAIWGMTWRDWLGSPWIGWGFGAFGDRMTALQLHAHAKPGQTVTLPLGELFDTAHNEWLQLAYSGGLVALLLLGAWLWMHRAMLASPYAGSVIALAILSVGFFPLRLATTAAVAIVVCGLATAESA